MVRGQLDVRVHRSSRITWRSEKDGVPFSRGGSISSSPTYGAFSEDNARFLILAILLFLYMACGAAIFSVIEQPTEMEAIRKWEWKLRNFSKKHNIPKEELRDLMVKYEMFYQSGIRVNDLRSRWDFTGSLYFVGTVVSTIGFGMTTPITTTGRIFLIFFGLIGCAGNILFFNLFLERTITVIAYLMKSCYMWQLKKKRELAKDSKTSENVEAESITGWKPSVYYVMLTLCLASLILSCIASVMYSAAEGWSYIESLYFCFVAFSTIGFGDLVSSQNASYKNQAFYRCGNFIFLVTGSCCMYSLFNVISIVIKQFINWVLKKMDKTYSMYSSQRNVVMPGTMQSQPRVSIQSVGTQRNVVMPGTMQSQPRVSIQSDGTQRNVVMPGTMQSQPSISIQSDDVFETATEGSRTSSDTTSMKDYFSTNVSLAAIPKRFSQASSARERSSMQNGFAGGVGALGIMSNRLAETSTDR